MSPGACKEIARKSATEYEVGRKIAMISLGGIPLGLPGDDARRGGPCRVSGVAMRGVHFRDKIRYRRRDGADRLPSSVAAAGAESGSDCLGLKVAGAGRYRPALLRGENGHQRGTGPRFC